MKRRRPTAHELLSRALNPAQAAAEQLMRERQHVVIGFDADEPVEVTAGAETYDLGGKPLADGYVLRVQKQTTRADWEEQLKALGMDPNKIPEAPGQRYYACTLEPDEAK